MMSMFSFLGKLCVLLILTTSVLCLMGGVAVYTQKMDYVTPRGGEAGKKTLNRVDQAREKAKGLLAANQRAITRLSLEMEPLVDVEGDIMQRRDYYYALLEMMTTGKWYDVPSPQPIQEIRFGVDTTLTEDITDTQTNITVRSSAGFPATPFVATIGGEQIQVANITRNSWTVVRGFNNSRAESHGAEDVVTSDAVVRIHTNKEEAPKQPAIMVFTPTGDRPAQPGSVYIAEIQRIAAEIEKTIAETRKLIAGHKAATIAINGSEMVKGLRTRIKEQIQIKEDAEAEAAFLEDYVSRRQAEAELFVKRRDALADRLVELKKFFGIEDKPGVQGNNGSE